MYNLKWKFLDIKRTPVKKKIFSRQKWLQKIYLKMWGSLIKVNLKIQDTTKSDKKKRCGIIRLDIQNFL